MNISQNNIKLIKKIDKLATKHGYIKDINSKIIFSDEKDIINLMTWFNPKDKSGNTFINVYYHIHTPNKLMVNWYYWGGPSGNDSLNLWTMNSTWVDMKKL